MSPKSICRRSCGVGAAGAFVALFLSVTTTASEMRAQQVPVVRPTETIVLFNGKNLDGFYTYLETNKYKDPKHVFTVKDGVLRISGEEWGGLTTRKAYRDYHLVVEWKWGGLTWAPREDSARDSGILVHGTGPDGAASRKWLESIEYQVIEGGVGDFILVAGRERPLLTVETREGPHGQLYWHKGGPPQTRDRGRFNWYGRDPEWKDVHGFRGRGDVAKPAGEWNRSEVICDGDTITAMVNGTVVNRGTACSLTQGKIQLQSEGAEILIRKVELLPLGSSAK